VRRLSAFPVLALFLAGPVPGEKIYVFCPSMAKPNAVQAVLQAKCSGSEITVFGRLADFTAMVGATPPDVILAPKPLADQFPLFKPFLKGTRRGAPNEGAVLVSTRPIETGAVATLNVGVVGILDRAPMNALVQAALGATPRLKVVTKVEDLLPLLTFGSADAILVGEGQVEEIRSRTQASLESAPGPGRMPLVVAASKGDPGRTETALKSLGSAEKKMLGVDGWTR